VSISRRRVRAELLVFLRVLSVGAGSGEWFDVRWRTARGAIWRRALAAGDVAAAAQHIAGVSAAGDVFVGVALRNDRQHGGKKSIAGSRLLFLDCDEPHPSLVAHFEHPPTLVVASGTPGRLQLYWALQRRAPIDAVEEANRRLAFALHGDAGSTDAARVLRAPGTLNHKHDPPRPVRLVLHRPNARYELTDLTADLPNDPLSERTARPPRSHVTNRRTALERALLEIPAEDYARVLARETPNHEGKILCPFHQETVPSLQLYPDGSFYCFGSSCRRGGTIFDFAAYRWGIAPRREGFAEILTRLAQRFGLAIED
jgi:RepB DNA-primase from phage plasmid/CHC2 zinc finger